MRDFHLCPGISVLLPTNMDNSNHYNPGTENHLSTFSGYDHTSYLLLCDKLRECKQGIVIIS